MLSLPVLATIVALTLAATPTLVGGVLTDGLETGQRTCYPACDPPPAVTPVAAAGSVAVTVYGSGVTTGGGSFSVPSRSMWVAPVCFYITMGTGRQYADALNHGLEDSVLRMLPAAERSTPLPGWEEHSTDDAGLWWIPSCVDTEPFAAYNAGNDPVFVIPGGVVPAGIAAVDPQVLAQVAYDAMDLPTGIIRWNPTLAGSGATIVNLDTVVWVEGGPTQVSITAEVPGVWARVDATLDHLDLAAEGADPGTCPGAGKAWTGGADTTVCSVVFFRSSANQPIKAGHDLPTATLTATATWNAAWVSSLEPNPTNLPTQQIAATTEIPVAEIQSLVTTSSR